MPAIWKIQQWPQDWKMSVFTLISKTMAKNVQSESESHSAVSDSLQPHGLYSPWNSPGQKTRVGSCSFLQGIFQIQRLNYHTIALISHTSTVMIKFLTARLQWNVNHGLPDAQAGFRKDRGTRDTIAIIHWIIKKPREFQKKKKSTSALLIMPKPLTVWITTN